MSLVVVDVTIVLPGRELGLEHRQNSVVCGQTPLTSDLSVQSDCQLKLSTSGGLYIVHTECFSWFPRLGLSSWMSRCMKIIHKYLKVLENNLYCSYQNLCACREYNSFTFKSLTVKVCTLMHSSSLTSVSLLSMVFVESEMNLDLSVHYNSSIS